MEIVERQIGRVTILDLKGKLALWEGDRLLKEKVDSLLACGRKQILLNMPDVPYVDSAGTGEVLRCMLTAHRAGGSLKLLNITKRFEDFLMITRMLGNFECFNNEAEAIASFSKPTPAPQT